MSNRSDNVSGRSKSALNVLIYRLQFLFKKSGAQGLVQRWPASRRALEQIKRLTQRNLHRTQAWVRIESGLSQGMWMHVRLPGETRLWRGEHEPEVQNAIRAAVRPGDIVYDIGSHLGSLSLGTARLVGPTGRVLAFDGDPENIERLLGNSERNQLGRSLHVLHRAVWSHTASDGISFRRGITARSQGGVEADEQSPVIAKGELITVPSITLDDLIASSEPPPQLIKIDVEGGEYEVLRGGDTLFSTHRPLLIIEIHHQQASEQIAAWIDEHRYKAQWNIPKEKLPICLFAWPAEKDGEKWMRDSLAVPG
jgi:FkbM family methyltransferase